MGADQSRIESGPSCRDCNGNGCEKRRRARHGSSDCRSLGSRRKMIVARRPTKTIIAFRIKRGSNPPLGPGDCRGRFYLRKATERPQPFSPRLGSLARSSGTVARLGRRSRWNLQDLCYPIRVKADEPSFLGIEPAPIRLRDGV